MSGHQSAEFLRGRGLSQWNLGNKPQEGGLSWSLPVISAEFLRGRGLSQWNLGNKPQEGGLSWSLPVIRKGRKYDDGRCPALIKIKQMRGRRRRRKRKRS